MLYIPDSQSANRFPWRFFLSQTKLSRATFKDLFESEDFLATVANAYEAKGSLLNDREMYECVERAYFSRFKMFFVSEDILMADAVADIPANRPEVVNSSQPHIEGYTFDYGQRNQKIEFEQRKSFSKELKTLRTCLQKFSKELYGDIHAWFSDFEEYFRQQQNSD